MLFFASGWIQFYRQKNWAQLILQLGPSQLCLTRMSWVREVTASLSLMPSLCGWKWLPRLSLEGHRRLLCPLWSSSAFALRIFCDPDLVEVRELSQTGFFTAAVWMPNLHVCCHFESFRSFLRFSDLPFLSTLATVRCSSGLPSSFPCHLRSRWNCLTFWTC